MGTLPLTLLGLGAASWQEVKGARQTLADDNALGSLGLGDKDRATIANLARTGRMDEAMAALKDAMGRRDPAIAQQVLQQVEAMASKQAKAFQDLMRHAGLTISREGDQYIITNPAGARASFNSAEEAVAAVQAHVGVGAGSGIGVSQNKSEPDLPNAPAEPGSQALGTDLSVGSADSLHSASAPGIVDTPEQSRSTGSLSANPSLRPQESNQGTPGGNNMNPSIDPGARTPQNEVPMVVANPEVSPGSKTPVLESAQPKPPTLAEIQQHQKALELARSSARDLEIQAKLETLLREEPNTAAAEEMQTAVFPIEEAVPGDHVNEVFKVSNEQGSAIFKPENGQRQEKERAGIEPKSKWKREIAASLVARRLAVDLIPPHLPDNSQARSRFLTKVQGRND